MKRFIEMAAEKRFENSRERFLTLYNESRDLGGKLAGVLLPMQDLCFKNIKARKELAEAVDELDYSTALEAEKGLTEAIAEVTLLLKEIDQLGKTE